MGWQRCVEEFIHDFFADHSNGRLAITCGMSGNKEADDRPCRGEWHGKTIVEIANGSAFRMGYLSIRS
jgi:hypothetical protein